MADDTLPPVHRRPADNSARWPELTGGLAAAAGCECQLLALAMLERASAPRERAEPEAGRPTKQ